jgi:His/Glu/Gln/Arg/opine family amino acid ABC transporter permease subunit
MKLFFGAVLPRLDYLLAGLAVTLGVSAATLVLSFFLGVGLALCRVARRRVWRWFAAGYIDVFRNTPFLVQLFFFYYGLPEIGVDLAPVLTGILALSLATATHNAEVLRAGIQAVDKGVVEAAHSLGLSGYQTFRRVILPIALRHTLRPMGSVFINMVLTTSILSTITVNDLLGNAMTVSAETFRPFEVYLVLLLLYGALTFSLSAALNLAYRRLDKPAGQVAPR